MSLPLERSIEHIIKVNQGQTLPNLSPIGIDTTIIIKIEILVQDLLKNGVKTKIINPYAAQIVLVFSDGKIHGKPSNTSPHSWMVEVVNRRPS